MKALHRSSAILISVVMLICGAAFAQKPVPGTEMVETSDFGKLPREIIWQRDNSVMILIPAGEYQIGIDDPTDVGFKPDEGPAVTVEIGSYYIDKTEVSNAQYKQFAQVTGASLPRTIYGREKLLDDGRPVVGIPYYDGLQYAEYMAKDLPTEAEWEIAARGKEAFLYPWGNQPDKEAALIGAGGSAMTLEVGTQTADESPFGVLDMAGNVSEWTKDFFDRGYHEAAAGKKNPRGPEEGESMVVKGGNYYEDGDGRATARLPRIPGQTRDEIGFRTVYRLKPWPTPTPTPEKRVTPTPTPGIDDRARVLSEKVEEYFRDPTRGLPTAMTGSMTNQTSMVPVMNATPHMVLLTFADIDQELLYNFPVRMFPGQITIVRPPADRNLAILAYADGSQLDRVAYLGMVYTDSHPFTIIKPETFNTVTTQDGEVLSPMEKDVEAQQIYDILNYTAMWNIFEVFNDTRLPVEVTVSSIPAGTVPAKQHKATIPAGESLQVDDFGGGKVRIEVRYVGAEDPSGPAWEFDNSGLRDHRVVVMKEDTTRDDFVRVLTRRMPLITMTTVETEINRSRYYVSPDNDQKRRR
ncbi:formylglycine-generating enzyme family protein [bacterium]|nr:formylglycine-generating enzyme family protein [bacterium]